MADVAEMTWVALGARIDTLEMRVAYQDEVIEQLNGVIVAQWGKLDEALARLARLEQRIREGQDSAGGGEGDVERRPPHW